MAVEHDPAALPASSEQVSHVMIYRLSKSVRYFLIGTILCLGITGVSAKKYIGMDTAWLTVKSDIKDTVQVFAHNVYCHECKPMPVYHQNKPVVIKSGENYSMPVNTSFATQLILKNDSNHNICITESSFKEHWNYELHVTSDSPEITNKIECMVLPNDYAQDAFLPIYIAIAIMVVLSLLWIFIKWIIRKHYLDRFLNCLHTNHHVNLNVLQDLGVAGDTSVSYKPTEDDLSSKSVASPKKQRLRSLDTFRGISIVIMIFVNYGGGGYWFFKHSAWNGLTVADLVFPWFVFIMGTSTTFSFSGQLSRGVMKKKIFLKIIQRSVILFLLGLVVNTATSRNRTHLNDIRIPGVLQRFSLTYLVVASLYLCVVKRDIQGNGRTRGNVQNISTRWSWLSDLLPYWPEWIVHICILIMHIVLTFYLHIHGCPTGYIGPGGISNNGTNFNCTGGAAALIDRAVFGQNHIYQHSTAMRVYYNTTPHDPEGLLGTFTCIFLCFLGLQAGKIIRHHTLPRSRIIRMIIWALLTGMIAAILCECKREGGWIPVNKNLWSVSFVLALSSMAFILLAICYILIDVKTWWTGAPFYYAGMNALLLYLGHEILGRSFPISFVVPETHLAQLSMDLWGAVFWALIAIWLDYKGFYFSV